ncbi:MAG: 30S ribosomal protein S6 [Candidatus Didemnitutus sp.]|nr:30S ribosomal protein S6 [Candidatus Didemnitutus sp.]
MKPNKRNYKATFILDNRGKEDSVDQIIEGVKTEIAAVQGEVTNVEQLGRRDFVRVTDDKFPAGVYVQIAFSAPAEATAQLHERLRLNSSVYRALVENA